MGIEFLCCFAIVEKRHIVLHVVLQDQGGCATNPSHNTTTNGPPYHHGLRYVRSHGIALSTFNSISWLVRRLVHLKRIASTCVSFKSLSTCRPLPNALRWRLIPPSKNPQTCPPFPNCRWNSSFISYSRISQAVTY